MNTVEIIDKVTTNPTKYRLTHRNRETVPVRPGHWRFEWENTTRDWDGHRISSMTAKAALQHGTWADEKLGNTDPFTAYTLKLVNPFLVARREDQVKTIGDAIRLLVDAFSQEGSGDLIGSYILEEAAKEVRARESQRKVEWDEIMARIYQLETVAE